MCYKSFIANLEITIPSLEITVASLEITIPNFAIIFYSLLHMNIKDGINIVNRMKQNRKLCPLPLHRNQDNCIIKFL